MNEDEIKKLKAEIEKLGDKPYKILWKDAMMIANENARKERHGTDKMNANKSSPKTDAVEALHPEYNRSKKQYIEDGKTPASARQYARRDIKNTLLEAGMEVSDRLISDILK